jgi:hypothetical protein
MRLLTMFILVLATSSCTHRQTVLRLKIAAHSEVSGLPGMRMPADRATVIYADHGRLRVESSASPLSPALVVIQRCDTHVIYTLDSAKREYTESPLPLPASKEPEQKSNEGPPNLVIDTRTVDSGETKSAFGHTAHHYITTTKQTPSPELDEQPAESVVDAWYLGVPDVMTCEPVSPRPRGVVSGFIGNARVIPRIRPEFRYSGPEPQGLVLSEKASTRSVHVLATGEKQNTELANSREIVEMSEVPIDAGLFEVPSGFTRVKRIGGNH